jgi:hypothetical protein
LLLEQAATRKVSPVAHDSPTYLDTISLPQNMVTPISSSFPDVRDLAKSVTRLCLNPAVQAFVPTVKSVRPLKADAYDFVPDRASGMHHLGFYKLPDELKVEILRLVIPRQRRVSALTHQVHLPTLLAFARVSRNVRDLVYEI